MQSILFAFVATCGLTALAVACGPVHRDSSLQTAPAEPVVERPFAAGGRVAMRLSAGEYTIEGSPDAQIRLEWQTRDPDDAKRVRVAVTTEERSARIETHGPHNGFSVRIGVPVRSDLWVRLMAGDLTLKGVEGHKDIAGWAGDFKIDVGAPDRYRAVDASVLAGEIDARPFGGSKGGLFRSFRWNGQGRYDLRARLTAGEIALRD
jgi:hypothetical protein